MRNDDAVKARDEVAKRLTSDQRAATWDRIAAAAQQWDAERQRRLGDMYKYGEGAPRNHEKAVKFYHMAAEQGDDFAQWLLASMYHDSNGMNHALYLQGMVQNYVQQDYQKAAKWYRKAAEQGNDNAQESLGEMYRDGQGVPQNDAEAYFWLLLASVNGDENRAKARDTVAQNLTPEQRAAVQNRAAAWRPSKPE